MKRKIFVQEHSSRKEGRDKPAGKTLFVVNVPPYVHEKELLFAYGKVGPVDSVVIVASGADDTVRDSAPSKYFNASKPQDKFKMAYVVFKSTKSLQKALRTDSIDFIDGEKSILETGILRWKNEYDNSFVDEKQLLSEVSAYMDAFELKEKAARDDAKKTEVDEDGWITVKRGKIGGGFEQKESVIKALEEKIEKGKAKKQFKNFYTFQIRESKQKHIVSLRRRFQEDKLKIEALKKSRRFKPF